MIIVTTLECLYLTNANDFKFHHGNGNLSPDLKSINEEYKRLRNHRICTLSRCAESFINTSDTVDDFTFLTDEKLSSWIWTYKVSLLIPMKFYWLYTSARKMSGLQWNLGGRCRITDWNKGIYVRSSSKQEEQKPAGRWSNHIQKYIELHNFHTNISDHWRHIIAIENSWRLHFSESAALG